MLLSEILHDMGWDHFQIEQEREFEDMGLLGYTSGRPSLAFVDNIQFMSKVTSPISMVLTVKELVHLIPEGIGACVAENPREVFFKVHNHLSAMEEYRRKRFSTQIGEGCEISEKASIARENVFIGDNVIIEEFAVIRENTVIEDGAIIRAGAIIGGQGFEYKRMGKTTLLVEHEGGVVIREGAEVQYHTCIDRAVYPWDDTEVGAFCRIDNHVHIGHAVKLGRCALITAGSVIAGRTVIGDDVWIGVGATIANAIHIGSKARISMGSVVIRDVADGQHVMGNVAIEHSKFMLSQARYM